MNPELRPPTSAEIDRRLWIVSELRNLCLSLGRARRVEDEENAAPASEAYTDTNVAHSSLAASTIPR